MDIKKLARKLKKKEIKLEFRTKKTLRLPEEKIPVKINGTDSLFDSLDPSSLECRDLTAGAEEYVLKKLEGCQKISRITIELQFDSRPEEAEKITEGVKNYFHRKAQGQLEKNLKTRNFWILHFFGGVLFVAVCLVAAHILELNSDKIKFFKVLSESVGIISWIGIWEPTSYLIYGHKENSRKLMAYMKLDLADVVISEA